MVEVFTLPWEKTSLAGYFCNLALLRYNNLVNFWSLDTFVRSGVTVPQSNFIISPEYPTFIQKKIYPY
jgi:hypothetical protein